jgi:hypothetical protein
MANVFFPFCRAAGGKGRGLWRRLGCWLCLGMMVFVVVGVMVMDTKALAFTGGFFDVNHLAIGLSGGACYASHVSKVSMQHQVIAYRSLCGTKSFDACLMNGRA